MVCRKRGGLFVGLTMLAGGVFNGRALAAWVVEPVDLSGQVGWTLMLDTDPTGAPHASFFTTSPNGDQRYTRRGAGGWQQQGIIDNASAFAIDRNGQQFFVSRPEPNFYPQLQARFDNGLILQQQLASHTISSDVFLDFDSLNRPHIAYVHPAAQQLKHAFWNGTSWTTSIVATGSQFQFANSSFVATMDGQNAIHFAWANSSTGLLQYAKPTGSTTWQVSSPFPTLDAFPYDIDVDAGGGVHLAYDVFTGLVSTGGLFYSFYNGSAWSGGRVSGLDGFGAARSQVVADGAGKPHLFTYDSAFGGPDVLKHVQKVNGNWTSETLASYTTSLSGPDNIEAMMDDAGFHVLHSTGNKEIYYAFQALAANQPGDFDSDGDVDGADFVAWQTNFPKGDGATRAQGDADSDGDVDGADFVVWQTNFPFTPAAGAAPVPEPAGGSLLLAAFGAAGLYWQFTVRERRRAR